MITTEEKIKLIIKGKNDEDIHSLEEYKLFAAPQGGDFQWKDGHSAKEFAKYILACNGCLPEKIQNIIKPYVEDGETLLLYPEHNTSFGAGMGRGRSRAHDGLLVGKNFVVGIEAKVNEPFGQYYLTQSILNEHPKYKKVADGVLKNNLKKEDFDKIRYQLCQASYTTIKEAKDRNAQVAVFLVIALNNGCVNEKNEADFKKFVEFLEKGDEEDRYLPKYAEDKVKFYVKNLTI